MSKPYPRRRYRPAGQQQYFPAGFDEMHENGVGRMLWHGYDPSKPGATSKEAAKDFPAHAIEFEDSIPLHMLRRRVPHRIVRTNRSVTELPTTTYDDDGTLVIYVANDPRTWVKQSRHLDQQSNVWKSYRDLNRQFTYMFDDLVVVNDPVLGWDVRAVHALPVGREFPYYGRVVVGHVGLEHAFDVGDHHLVAQADLQPSAKVINDPDESKGVCQYINEASIDGQINTRFVTPPRMDIEEGSIVIAAVCVTTKAVAAGQSLRVCYNDPEGEYVTFGDGTCLSDNGQPMRLLNRADVGGKPLMYPIAPACVAGQDLQPCSLLTEPMQVKSNPRPTPFDLPHRDLGRQMWPVAHDPRERPYSLKRTREK
jgi:hypothetical protein